MGNTARQPLVSIVITLYNGARFISWPLLSCMHQTYRNLDILVLDDASTDDTEAVVKQYAEQDKRIRYVRNEKNIGYARSLHKVAWLAMGEYVQLLGADDWLERNYIETVVEEFEKHPKAACVAAEIISLRIMPEGNFKLIDGYLPKKKTISKDTFIRSVYRSDVGSTLTPLALFRKEDFLESAGFMKEMFEHPPQNVPPELPALQLKGHGTGDLFLLKTIHKYDYLILTDKTAFMKTEHFENANKPHNLTIDWTSAGRILRSYYYGRLGFEYLFRNAYRNFWAGFRLFFGTDPFVSIFVTFVKQNFKYDFFSDLKREDMKTYFADYSLFEKIVSAFFLPIHFMARAAHFLFIRPLDTSRRHDINVRQQGYFLDEAGRFQA